MRNLVLTYKNTSQGRILKPNLGNVECILTGRPDNETTDGPEWLNAIRWNELAGRPEKTKPIPSGGEPGPWSDVDTYEVVAYLSREVNMEVQVQVVEQAMMMVASRNPFHPVRDYLDKVAPLWDGVSRIDTVFQGVFHAETCTDNPHYLKMIARMFFTAMVARIFEPGCKFDHMPILEGVGGIGKSLSLRKLMPDERWYSDDFSSFDKEGVMQLMGHWLVEYSELTGLSKKETNEVKAFISRQTDKFRPPYGKGIIEQPRRCVIVGTSNHTQYLHDETGNRRFWPVKCGQIDIRALEAMRDQLWGEAVHLYRAGEVWHFVDTGVMAAVNEETEMRMVGDVWEERLSEMLETESRVSSEGCFQGLGFDQVSRVSKQDQARLRAVMTHMGWVYKQYRPPENKGKRVWGWVREGTDPVILQGLHTQLRQSPGVLHQWAEGAETSMDFEELLSGPSVIQN